MAWCLLGITHLPQAMKTYCRYDDMALWHIYPWPLKENAKFFYHENVYAGIGYNMQIAAEHP